MSNGNGNGTFHRPADGPVSSWAGPRAGTSYGAFNTHYGVDIAAQFGWTVRAAWNGTVTRIYGSGNDRRVILKHNGFLTSYLHNSRITVKVGQRVTAGQKIAEVGTAGTGPHLHWEYHPGAVWNGIYTASVAQANNWIRGTRTDASSNPPNRGTSTPASSQPTPAPSTPYPGGTTMSWTTRLKSHITGNNLQAGTMLRDVQRKAHQARTAARQAVSRLDTLRDRVWTRNRKSLVTGNNTSMSAVVAWSQYHATHANWKIDALASTLDELLDGQGKLLKAVKDVETNVTITGAEEVAKRLKITVEDVEEED